MELPKFLWQEWLSYEEIVVNEERGLIEQKYNFVWSQFKTSYNIHAFAEQLKNLIMVLMIVFGMLFTSCCICCVCSCGSIGALVSWYNHTRKRKFITVILLIFFICGDFIPYNPCIFD